MYSSLAILFLIFKSGNSCIPTQTTCSTCMTIYDSSCSGLTGGYGPPGCETEADVGVSYTYGSAPGLAGLGDVCWNQLSCPAPTMNQYDFLTGPVGGSPTAYCRETGAGAGIWYIQVAGVEETLTSMRCTE